MSSDELFIFVRFHARLGSEADLGTELGEVMVPTRAEPGCLAADVFRSTADPRLFIIHSRWRNEVAFETHAGLSHTISYIERVPALLDHEFEVVRTRQMPRVES